jgi:aminoglycoside phosphotransferase
MRGRFIIVGKLTDQRTHMPMTLPPAIAQFIDGATLKRETRGESPCQVHRFRKGTDVFFLKSSAAVYAPTTYSVQREAAVLRWLSGQLKVPDVVVSAETDDAEYMVTRAVPGRPLSALKSGQHASLMLQEALRQVQAVPISRCPFDSRVAPRLQELDYLMARGLIDEGCDLQQWPGLATPADLRALLQATMPAEDLVFSHGDLGDSNVFWMVRTTCGSSTWAGAASRTGGSTLRSCIADCVNRSRRRRRRCSCSTWAGRMNRRSAGFTNSSTSCFERSGAPWLRTSWASHAG